MDNFIQITVLCPPEPRVGAFVYRNAGKVYMKNYADLRGCYLPRPQQASYQTAALPHCCTFAESAAL